MKTTNDSNLSASCEIMTNDSPYAFRRCQMSSLMYRTIVGMARIAEKDRTTALSCRRIGRAEKIDASRAIDFSSIRMVEHAKNRAEPFDRARPGSKRRVATNADGTPIKAICRSMACSNGLRAVLPRFYAARGTTAASTNASCGRAISPSALHHTVTRAARLSNSALAVERSFAWAARFRRLARDYGRLPQTLAGFHFPAVACLMPPKIFDLIHTDS